MSVSRKSTSEQLDNPRRLPGAADAAQLRQLRDGARGVHRRRGGRWPVRGVPLLLPAPVLPEGALQEAAAQAGEGQPGQRPGRHGLPAPGLQVPRGQSRHGDGDGKRTLIRKTRR